MAVSQIAKEQRTMTLSKYGFDIQIEEDTLSRYKYTIKNGKFSVTAYRDTKDELDTLCQVILYLDTYPHKLALAEAKAYYDCSIACTPQYGEFLVAPQRRALTYIREKLREASKVDLDDIKLQELRINNLDSLHCTNVIGLEESRKDLISLYASLKWVAKCSEQHNCEYESIIKLPESIPEQSAPNE